MGDEQIRRREDRTGARDEYRRRHERHRHYHDQDGARAGQRERE
jgi:hypothetical protein